MDILEIAKIMEKAQIMHLGLCNETQAYVVPLNFGFEIEDKEIIIYFHSAKQGRKCDMIKKNNQCAVEMTSFFELKKGEKACQWSAFHESIMLEGIVTLIESLDERKKAMDLIMGKYGFKGKPIYDDKYLNAMNVYCIRVKSISGKRHLPYTETNN